VGLDVLREGKRLGRSGIDRTSEGAASASVGARERRSSTHHGSVSHDQHDGDSDHEPLDAAETGRALARTSVADDKSYLGSALSFEGAPRARPETARGRTASARSRIAVAQTSFVPGRALASDADAQPFAVLESLITTETTID